MPDPAPRPPRQPSRQRDARPQPNRAGGRPHGHVAENPVVQKLLALATDSFLALGAGLPPEYYHKVFIARLNASGISVQTKPRGVLKHRDKVADVFTPDFLCEHSVVLDLHTAVTEFSAAQISTTASAQKFFSAAHGLMLDFSGTEVRHRLLLPGGASFPTIPQEEILRGNTVEKHDELRALMLCRSLLRVGRAHGLGFCERTYRGLLRVEFEAEMLDYEDEPTVPVACDGLALGETKLPNLMTIQRSGALLVLAQQDGIRASDKLRLRAALRYLKLPWGLIAHFGRRRFEWQWV